MSGIRSIKTSQFNTHALTQVTIRATVWALLLQFVRLTYQLVIWVVIARMLVPSDYGLVGMASVVTGLVTTFSTMGLTQALIQRKELDRGHIDSAFWGCIGIGVLLFIAISALSPLVASFYHQPELTNILIVISLGFVTNAFYTVQVALLQRSMRFRDSAIVTALGLIPAIICALYGIYHGWGLWSLVVPPLLIGPATFLASIPILRLRVRFSFSLSKLWELLHFGGNVAGSATLSYLSTNIPIFIIGRYLGAFSLGLYAMANKLMMFPLTQVSTAVAQPLFSATAKVQDDNARIRRGYLGAIRYVAIVTFPMMAGLFVLSHDFILFVYGEKWLPVTPLIRAFCILGAVRSISTYVGTIFKTKGRPGIELKWNILFLSVLLPVLFITTRWSLMSMVWRIIIVTLLLVPVVIQLSNKLIDLTWRSYIRNLQIPFFLSTLMALVIYLVRYGLNHINFNVVGAAVVALIFGLSVYLVGLWLTDRESIQKVLHIFFSS